MKDIPIYGTIYLAGGMKSGWQDTVMEQKWYPIPAFIDPRNHGLNDPIQYTKWDLEAIQLSDYVFGYIEKSNPRPYGLAVELGFAHALGKKIFLVDEQQNKAHSMMVSLPKIHVYSSLEEGIDVFGRYLFLDWLSSISKENPDE